MTSRQYTSEPASKTDRTAVIITIALPIPISWGGEVICKEITTTLGDSIEVSGTSQTGKPLEPRAVGDQVITCGA